MEYANGQGWGFQNLWAFPGKQFLLPPAPLGIAASRTQNPPPARGAGQGAPRKMKIKPKAAAEPLPGQGSPEGGAGGGSDGGPGLGGLGFCPPAAPAHLVASFVDRGRGALAQEVLGAPQVAGGALHVRRGARGSPRGSPPPEPPLAPRCPRRSGNRLPRAAGHGPGPQRRQNPPGPGTCRGWQRNLRDARNGERRSRRRLLPPRAGN